MASTVISVRCLSDRPTAFVDKTSINVFNTLARTGSRSLTHESCRNQHVKPLPIKVQPRNPAARRRGQFIEEREGAVFVVEGSQQPLGRRKLDHSPGVSWLVSALSPVDHRGLHRGYIHQDLNRARNEHEQ